MSPEEWMSKLAEHNEQNPKHGIGCICMDDFVRELRKMFPVPRPPYEDTEFTEWLKGPEHKLRSRIYNIFGMFRDSIYR